MIDIREKLAAIFKAEHAEHLEHIRSLLALLENVPEAKGTSELDEVFRRAHSLKGAARAVDLHPVEGLAGGLETIFSRVRDGTLRLDKKMIGVVRQVLDSSEDCLVAFDENRVLEEPVSALRAIDELLGVIPVSLPLAASGVEAGRVIPEQEAIPAARPTSQPGMVRLPGESLDRLVRSSGQIVMESLKQKTVTEELDVLGRLIAETDSECKRFRKASEGSRGRLAKLLPEFSAATRQIGLIEQRVSILASHSRKARLLQQRSAWTMHGSADQLQRDVWSARMAPVDDLFEGFRRMVRDLARDEKKEIDFRLKGSGVRADRLVLQTLKDPVMHLLRNAISHGIEAPRERERKGKSPVGSLTLDIESERGRLVIRVEDDGRGVDFKTVAKLATERGLLSQSGTGTAAGQELESVIFQPGFSTSPTVNDLSGRGMGLSVVYETTRRLQGEVNLERREGPGASIRLSVPLSVSTCHLLLVSSQGQIFGIPTHAIERIYRVKFERIEMLEGKSVVNLDGRQSGLFSLAQLLRTGDGSSALHRDILPVMLLKLGSKRVAIVVDKFVDERDALIQDLGMPGPAEGFVSGGALNPDGTVFIVLNPSVLAGICMQSAAFILKSEKPAAKANSFCILVVDDSITTRTLEKSVLQAHGYRVRVAVDGLEALEMLRAEKADLIITDVQMPRMDGFELLAAVKADEQLDGIPVIIVSSVEQPAEQQRGLLLGADAYIVKRKFDQQELLDAIEQIL